MSKGRYPLMSGVRDTTRRMAAALLSRNTANASRQSLPNPQSVRDDFTHFEDHEEQPTLLTSLASKRPNPLADLESLLPVRDTFNDEQGFIDLCNDLLVLNHQEHSDPTRRTIKIPGTTGVYISPNQFYHAWHLLSQRGRELNGGILADEAGTGKTFVFFAACLLRALAFESQRAVRLYWSGKGKKKVGRNAEHHLAQGANGPFCPSQKQGAITCYCVPGSLTRAMCDSTPSGVTALFCASESWPDILNMVQTAGLNPSVYQLCLVHNNAPARFTRPLQPLVNTLARGARPDLKDPSPASYIFITTLESPRLRNIFSEPTLNVGFSVIDEAHQILRTKDSLTFRMASEFSDYGADVWFVTATPFSGCSLADWVAPIKLIAPRRAAAMRALVASLDAAKLSRDAEHARSFRDNFEIVFDRDLVLRHFGTSKFLGKSITDVQDIVPRVISRETPFLHRIAVQELANQVAYRDPLLQDPSQRGLMYLVSLFPAAAPLILNDPITFDTASIRDLIRQVKNRLRIEDSEPLRRLADQIVQDSPKLNYILEELDRMGKDSRERDQVDNNNPRFGAGEDPKMKKMVVITPTVVSAVFLYLALIRHRPDVSLIHNWVSAQEKEQVVNNFRSLSAAKLVRHSRVLIAPFAAIGTGANLQVASYEILTSPLPDRASQVQAFARTNRSGQRLRPLSHKILVLEDSPVDRIVLASHATLEIESDPFNIIEPLRIAGHAALNRQDRPKPGLMEDAPFPASHSSTLGLDEGLLLQSAVAFWPPDGGNRPESNEEMSQSTSTDSDEASQGLLLQNALFWTPGVGIGGDNSSEEGHSSEGEHVSLFNDLSDETFVSKRQNHLRWSTMEQRSMNAQSSEATEKERSSRYDDFNISNNLGLSSPPTHDRHGDPGSSSMAAKLEQQLYDRSPSQSEHQKLEPRRSYSTIFPRHARDYMDRPLPPLPTETQQPPRSRQDQQHQPAAQRHRWTTTLSVPSTRGPPVRIDVGPTLVSQPQGATGTGTPLSAVSPAPQPHTLNMDALEDWVRNLQSLLPPRDHRRSRGWLHALTPGADKDNSPRPSPVRNPIRPWDDRSRLAAGISAHQDAIERVPGAFPQEMLQTEANDDNEIPGLHVEQEKKHDAELAKRIYDDAAQRQYL
jgi:hypothetical protein